MENTSIGRVYARYSGDKQRESSIEDQVRNCKRHAEHEGVCIQHVYEDRAISGAVTARNDYQAMLTDAATGAFGTLYVDDLSRLSRDEYEMKGVLRKLAWQGVRVVGVTDGYDSTRKGHKIHAGFKGLMNEMFLDDLRERTHRGMTGQALKGYNCGGRTFGYRNVPMEDTSRRDAYGRPAVTAVKYEIKEDQAAVVRQVYAWYAEGHSYKWIAAELNRRRVPASRGTTWAMSGVKVILENEMYEGRLIWNRRAWARHPETGRRRYRLRPQAEWIVSENPRLRIVPSDLLDAVRHRQNRNKELQQGIAAAAPAQRYLFSGLLVCARCGGSYVIVGRHRYGCASHKTRGTAVCTNSLTVDRQIVERTLLRTIKAQLFDPINAEKFKREARAVLERHNSASRTEGLVKDLQAVERVQQNLLEAIKQGIITSTTKDALEDTEAQIASLKYRIAQAKRWDVPTMLPQAVERFRTAVARLEQTLQEHVEPARHILKSLIGGTIQIHPRGEYLEAELPNHVRAVVAMCLNENADLSGCGGPHCSKSTFVKLVQETQEVMESANDDGAVPRREPQ